MPHGEQNDDDAGTGDADEEEEEDDRVAFAGLCDGNDVDDTGTSLFLLEPGRSDATATARIPPGRTPAATAVPTATRSAQIPAGYAAFSTLAPV